MDFSPMMTALKKGTVCPRSKILDEWKEHPGIYAVWGNAALARRLRPHKLEIHASKRQGGAVTLPLKQAIQMSVKRKDTDGTSLFCLYVGKTAYLAGRMQIQRYQRVHRLLEKAHISELKDMLRISFFSCAILAIPIFRRGICHSIATPRIKRTT